MVVARLALLSRTHAVASTYSFHPCYCDNSIHVPIKQVLEWLMTEACLSLDDMWFVSASSMMDVLWWALAYEMKIITLCPLHMFICLALTQSSLSLNLPSFLLPDSCPDGQVIQQCPWIPACSHFRPLLFPWKVVNLSRSCWMRQLCSHCRAIWESISGFSFLHQLIIEMWVEQWSTGKYLTTSFLKMW